MKLRPFAVGAGAVAGAALPALAFAPAAGAVTLPPLPTSPQAAVEALAEHAPPLPRPALPAPVVPVDFAMPTTLLRRDDGLNVTTADEPVATETSAPPAMDRPSFTADELNGAVLAAKLDRLATGDMTVISDLLPGMPVFDGAALEGLALPPMMTAPADTAPVSGVGVPVEEVARMASWINSLTIDPLGTIGLTLASVGGPQALLDPVGAITAIAATVAGPQTAADIPRVLFDLVLPAVAKDWPTAIGAGLLTLFGVPLLSGLSGAVLGASVGGLGASALALAALATVLFGTWLLAVAAVFLLSIPLAIAVGLVVFVVAVIAGLVINPAGWIIGAGAGIATAIFIPILLTAAFAVLTVAIPVILFALIAPFLLIGAALLGSIPGAILGGLGGYGAGLVAALPLAALVTALVGLWAGKNRMDNNPEARDALNRLRDLAARAWAESELGRFITSLQDYYWRTPIGQLHKLWNDFWARLWAGVDLAAIIDGAKRGGLQGIIDGFRTGFPAGALTTALWTLPLLLAGLAATLLPPLALAVAATLAAGVGLWLIPFLAAAPLWILGILFVGVTLFLGGVGIIAAIAGVALIAVAFVSGGSLAPLGILGGVLIFLGLALTGAMWMVGGFVAGIGMAVAIFFFALLLLSLAIAAVTVGIPVFLLTVPLFIFPALSLVAMWLIAVLAGGALAGTVGAIYGAGSGGWKGALAGLLRSLDVRGAVGVVRDGVPSTIADIAADPLPVPNIALPDFANPAAGFITDEPVATRVSAMAA